jgi:agmatine deiminase
MMARRGFLRTAGAVTAAAAGLDLAPVFGQAVDAAQRDRYWMPEETEPHLRTFMQWPVNREVHPDPVFLDMLQQSIADIANAISGFEPVVMLMEARHSKNARGKLAGNVEIWDIPTDDLWCRDSGPVFVRNAKAGLAVSHLNFNGWGGKQVHGNDGKIARAVATRLGLPLLDNGLVGEAGGVEADGEGTLIAHESSWINANRNPGPKPDTEKRMLEAFGADKIIWAPGVRDADITDYHIDSLARFIVPGKVIIQLPDHLRDGDPWSAAAFETHDILKSARDAKGRQLDLVVIPEPDQIRIQAEDFVASYVNYYVCNGAVIAAEFGDPEADAMAAETLAELYPGREIVTLNVDPVGEVGGGIHCATQQQPAV